MSKPASAGNMPAYAAGIMLVVIWANWNVVSRYGLLNTLTPADITLIRFVTGTVLTLPMLAFVKWRQVNWPQLAVMVLTYGFPYALASFYGLRESPAANAGVIVNGLLPLFAALYAWLWLRSKLPLAKVPALVIVVAANAVMLYAKPDAVAFSASWLWLVLACALIAGYMVAARAWQINILQLLPLLSLFNLLMFVPLWFVLPHQLGSASVEEIAVQAVFQGLINMVIVAWLFTYASKRLGSVTLSVLLAFVPAATALAGFAFLGEHLTDLEWIAVAGCTAGLIAYSLAAVDRGARS